MINTKNLTNPEKNETINLPKVQMKDIGLYIRTIQLDNYPDSPTQLALLITENFNVSCTLEDIIRYESLHFIHEDYEKVSREVEYNIYEQELIYLQNIK